MVNKELKDLIKEIAVLCVDKGINFNCSYHEEMNSFSIMASTFDGVKVNSIGPTCLVVVDWKESSEQDLIILKNEVVNHG
ncbi:MAG TPA: hypothetical protein VIG45_06810 [Erysipelothrix sp.]